MSQDTSKPLFPRTVAATGGGMYLADIMTTSRLDFDSLNWDEILKPLDELKNCSLCPRDCRADRTLNRLGYCSSTDGYHISSVFAHKGEEPVLSGTRGICNVFFTSCNLQCVYCQNYQISRHDHAIYNEPTPLRSVVQQIEQLLDRGTHGVGFVSPSHFVPQMKVIINTLRARGSDRVFVFNSNGYDRAETISGLREYIDVYLPDLKYADDKLARELSDVDDYVETAQTALREMFAQTGEDITLNGEGTIEKGMIIRHLVLPGQVENSKKVLRFIADQLSPSLHISLMAQYHPNPSVASHPSLNRLLKAEEYEEVLDEFDRLGFHRGFVQSLDSSAHYLPDFMRDSPFEDSVEEK